MRQLSKALNRGLRRYGASAFPFKLVSSAEFPAMAYSKYLWLKIFPDDLCEIRPIFILVSRNFLKFFQVFVA